MPPVAVRWVLLRDPRGQFATQAVLCTVDPLQSVSWFILRWQLEVTFREVRAHLGVETQRQWSDQVIARTTPTLLGLFSVVTVLADGHLRTRSTFPCRPSAWDSKSLPTVVDALALVRRHLWASTACPMSAADADLVKVPRVLVEHLHELLCYAA